jgi:muconate cycloisomerase
MRADAPRIERVEAIAVSLPVVKPLRMAFEEVRRAENVVVRVQSDAGTVGWGEAASAPAMTGETVESMTAAVRHLAPRLQGERFGDIGAVLSRAGRYLYGNAAARSAIDMALHDLVGRTLGQPVYELLGGKRRTRIALLRMIGSGTLAGDVDEARRCRGEGYVAYKVKVGIAEPLADAARTRAVCEALGPGVLICADANQGWSVEEATAYVKAVADTPLAFFEQPVAAHDIDGMAAVARASRIPIGADEGLHSIEDLRRHHSAGAACGGSLKTIKLGGVRAVYDAARLCAELGMHVNLACKLAESSIAAAAMLHLAAAIPAVDWGVSLSNQYLAADLVKEKLPVREGHLDVPQGPGLGIEVDEARVREHAQRL